MLWRGAISNCIIPYRFQASHWSLTEASAPIWRLKKACIMTNDAVAIIPAEIIEARILLLCGHKVMLDADLAELYGVATKALTRAVRRNRERFPEDFMFQLNADEFANLRRQFGASSGWGGRRSPPYAFTEQGVAMLSSVLRSKRAVLVNVEIMRAFVRLRQILGSHSDLKRRLDELECKYDAKFKVAFDAIRQLMEPPARPRKPIGFAAQSKA